jgi:aminopeptidase-like protein
MDYRSIGEEMFQWAADLFPICRSITGNGVRQTLSYIQRILPGLAVHEVPSGTRVFDWTVPDEWNIRDAWIKDRRGRKIIDFQKCNLHVMGYSEPVRKKLSREELQKHLHSIEDQPDAIPYVTSYYRKTWGFCLAHRDRLRLERGVYEVCIDSTLRPGSLTYADLILKGRERKEILLSTYICHPSMANNELSGPVVAAALGRWLGTVVNRRYTYRIVFLPETIGAITYLSSHWKAMKRNTVAGFVITCAGDDRAYSMLGSRLGNTLADRVAHNVLQGHDPAYHADPFLERGSDERQYCSPGVDLPDVSIMRSKYLTYPEYHTSLDNLSVISPKGLQGAYDVMSKCVQVLENNHRYRVKCLCEPQLGRHGIMPTTSRKEGHDQGRTLLNMIAYSDGEHDLVSVADRIGCSAYDLIEGAQRLLKAGLVRRVD